MSSTYSGCAVVTKTRSGTYVGGTTQVSSFEYEDLLNDVGTASVTIPARDALRSIFQQRYLCEIYIGSDRGVRYVGTFVITKETHDGDSITYSGYNLLFDLFRVNVVPGLQFEDAPLNTLIESLLSGLTPAWTADISDISAITDQFAIETIGDVINRYAEQRGLFYRLARSTTRRTIEFGSFGTDSNYIVFGGGTRSPDTFTTRRLTFEDRIAYDEYSDTLINRVNLIFPTLNTNPPNSIQSFLAPVTINGAYSINYYDDGIFGAYIEDTTSQTIYGRSDTTLDITSQLPQDAAPDAQIALAQMIYDNAVQLLETFKDPRQMFTARVFADTMFQTATNELPIDLLPGDKISLRYLEHVRADWDFTGDDTLFVLGVRVSGDADRVYLDVDVSNVVRPQEKSMTAAGRAMEQIQKAAQRARQNAAQQRVQDSTPAAPEPAEGSICEVLGLRVTNTGAVSTERSASSGETVTVQSRGAGLLRPASETSDTASTFNYGANPNPWAAPAGWSLTQSGTAETPPSVGFGTFGGATGYYVEAASIFQTITQTLEWTVPSVYIDEFRFRSQKNGTASSIDTVEVFINNQLVATFTGNPSIRVVSVQETVTSVRLLATVRQTFPRLWTNYFRFSYGSTNAVYGDSYYSWSNPTGSDATPLPAGFGLFIDNNQPDGIPPYSPSSVYTVGVNGDGGPVDLSYTTLHGTADATDWAIQARVCFYFEQVENGNFSLKSGAQTMRGEGDASDTVTSFDGLQAGESAILNGVDDGTTITIPNGGNITTLDGNDVQILNGNTRVRVTALGGDEYLVEELNGFDVSYIVDADNNPLVDADENYLEIA